ncbi:hypothetical protein M0804_014965 [Polistes exclamans]|nr:hypothetical protein M0804_014965 [Polistes exclamans]
MSTELTEVLLQLWINFKRGISVENTAEGLLLLGYYEFPEVCSASIKYWFNVFIEYELEYSRLNRLFLIRPGQIEEFLLQLLVENPSWTTDHYIDALKGTIHNIHYFMEKIGYIYMHGIWCKRQ